MKEKNLTFPAQTAQISLFNAGKMFQEWVGKNPERFAFIITRHRNNQPRIRECVNTKVLGANRLSFWHFKYSLPVNDYYKLCDKIFSEEGLKMVHKGGPNLLNSRFKVVQSINTVPDAKGAFKTYLVKRYTLVRRIEDGDRTYDGMLLFYEIINEISPYFAIPFLPEFVDKHGMVLKSETEKLRMLSCPKILWDKDFPIKARTRKSKELTLRICQCTLENMSDLQIAEILKTKQSIVNQRRTFVADKFKPYFPSYSNYGIALFFFDSKLIQRIQIPLSQITPFDYL